MLFMVPIFSIPLSIVVALYKVRSKKENNDKKLQSNTISTISVGFKTFALSILILYGLVSVYVLLVMKLASDSSLVGVAYIFAMPVVLFISIVAACIRMKKIKAILIFLMITVLPFSLYKWSHSNRQTEYYTAVTHMRHGDPNEADWREFFDKYENSTYVTKGTHNQLDLVLWIASIPQDILIKYVDHPDHIIKWSVAKNSSLPEKYMYEYINGDKYLRLNLARNPALPKDIIDRLLDDEEKEVSDAISETLANR